MKTVFEGECCTACLLVIEAPDSDSITDAERRACEAGMATECPEAYSWHTGEETGFSWSPCDVCGSELGGDRHQVFALGEEAPASPHEQPTKLPRARFWAWVNDGWVKLTLGVGDQLSHCPGGRHEEGYGYSAVTWEYETDGIIRRVCSSWGCDCDGRYSTGQEDEASFRHLRAFETPDGARVPGWQARGTYQRDYAAEAMGY